MRGTELGARLGTELDALLVSIGPVLDDAANETATTRLGYPASILDRKYLSVSWS